MAFGNYSVTDEWDTLFTATARAYRPGFVNAIFGELPLLYWLERGGRKRTQDGGLKIVSPLMYGHNTTVGSFRGYDTLDTTPQEGLTAVEYDWANLSGSISISWEEERKNAGVTKRIDLLKFKTQQTEMSMRKYLADLIHGIHGDLGYTSVGGDSSNTLDSVGGVKILLDGKGRQVKFNSLDHLVRSAWGMINPASATAREHWVGGLKVSIATNGGGSYAGWGSVAGGATTNIFWANYTNPGFDLFKLTEVGGALGPIIPDSELVGAGYLSYDSGNGIVDAMRSMYNRLSDGADAPDLILCTQEMFELYEKTLFGKDVLENREVGDAGFANLKFRRCTMMMDHGIRTKLASSGHSATAPAPPMYFLNSKFLEFVVDSQGNFEPTPFFRPYNQAARTSQILFMGNLCVNNRNKHGVLSGAQISTSNNGWNA